MKRHGPILTLFLAGAGLVGGLALLFQWRLAQGDVFPAYSSLRSDPLGTRALHDALAEIPGLHVERWHAPLGDLEPAPPRTLLFAGSSAGNWSRTDREELDAIDAALRHGSRVVFAVKAEAAPTRLEAENASTRKREAKEKSKKRAPPPVPTVDLRARWGAGLKRRLLMERSSGAAATEVAQAMGFPATIHWRSDVYFEPAGDADWKVLYRRGGQPVLIERRLGRGSLVLAADAYFLSNEALQNDRASALLAWMIGPHRRVVFDETHLGVAAQPGVAALARRYGLSAACFTLLLLAGLFIWRRMATFVPPAEETPDLRLTYHPAAGLEALLRRTVAPAELAAVCQTEWAGAARESDRARVAQALAAAPPSAPAVVLYNAAVRALKRR